MTLPVIYDLDEEYKNALNRDAEKEYSDHRSGHELPVR